MNKGADILHHCVLSQKQSTPYTYMSVMQPNLTQRNLT